MDMIVVKKSGSSLIPSSPLLCAIRFHRCSFMQPEFAPFPQSHLSVLIIRITIGIRSIVLVCSFSVGTTAAPAESFRILIAVVIGVNWPVAVLVMICPKVVVPVDFQFA